MYMCVSVGKCSVACGYMCVLACVYVYRCFLRFQLKT